MCSWKFVNINVLDEYWIRIVKDFKGHFHEREVFVVFNKKILNLNKSYGNRTNNIFFEYDVGLLFDQTTNL